MTTKRAIINMTASTASKLGFPALLRYFGPGECCIFMFHGLTDQVHTGCENVEEISMHADDFYRICALLAERYHVISLGEACAIIEQGKEFPSGSVVLTFDDGNESKFRLGYPILKKFGLPATVFLATDFIENRSFHWWDRVEYAIAHAQGDSIDLDIGGNGLQVSVGTVPAKRKTFLSLLPRLKQLPQESLMAEVAKIEASAGASLSNCDRVPAIYRPMTWDNAREMMESGLIEIGGHTHTHRILGRCTLETAEKELVTCRELLRKRLGIEKAHFSYPNGRKTDHTKETRKLVYETGFRSAVTTEHGFNGAGDDVFTLKRFSTGNDLHYVDVVASGGLRFLLNVNEKLKSWRQAA